MLIDYKKISDDLLLKERLDELLNKETDSIKIVNISSAKFCEIFNCEAEDFNGWQCDWWGTFDYKNTLIRVAGCAWYGTITLSIE